MKQKNQVFCEKREALEKIIAAKEKETNDVRGREEAAKMQTKTL